MGICIRCGMGCEKARQQEWMVLVTAATPVLLAVGRLKDYVEERKNPSGTEG